MDPIARLKSCALYVLARGGQELAARCLVEAVGHVIDLAGEILAGRETADGPGQPPHTLDDACARLVASGAVGRRLAVRLRDLRALALAADDDSAEVGRARTAAAVAILELVGIAERERARAQAAQASPL